MVQSGGQHPIAPFDLDMAGPNDADYRTRRATRSTLDAALPADNAPGPVTRSPRK
jgi:hypothetical protein